MIVCMLLFLFGGPMQTEFCRYVTGHLKDGPRQLDEHLEESVRLLINQLRYNRRVDEERLARLKTEGATHVTTHTDIIPSVELLHSFTKARLVEAILVKCENESFVDAISAGELEWDVLKEVKR